MLLLLPPSEGKTAPRRGDPLDLGALLGAPALTGPRRSLMDELTRLGTGPDTARVLGLGPRSAEEAALNTTLSTAPAAPAYALYTGVLYEAAGLHALARRKAVRRVLAEEVVILSGLWGALRATDAVPDHRLSMGVTLPGAGRLAAFWKPHLKPVILDLAQASGGVIVDCRSGAYSPAWQPAAADAVDTDPWRWVLAGGEDHTLIGTIEGSAPVGFRSIGAVSRKQGVRIDGSAPATDAGWESF